LLVAHGVGKARDIAIRIKARTSVTVLKTSETVVRRRLVRREFIAYTKAKAGMRSASGRRDAPPSHAHRSWISSSGTLLHFP
jgi:hypothetical protein